jgi:hypothetical protein
MMDDLAYVLKGYDRAAQAEYAGARHLIGARAIADSWLYLRAAFFSARFTIHHQIGVEGGLMPPCAAIRWSLDGTRDGRGAFGPHTGGASDGHGRTPRGSAPQRAADRAPCPGT